MSSCDLAVKVDDIAKCYRIGLQEQVHDSLGGFFVDFIKSPVRNYKKYRSLYKFEEKDDDAVDVLWALRGVSFEVNRGGVIGIIGRNGAGKSTLLKILSRITPPTRGQAEIHGRVSSLLEVGTGFHQELTGRENIFLNGTILGMRKVEVEKKFDEIVEFSGVEKFLDTPVKRYSSGMRVRLAFAVAAHLEPEILIIDEVLSVGDAAFQRKCLDKMQDVTQEGRTVLFVSHNMPAVTRMCDRVILLNNGKILEDGSSHSVVAAYLNAGFGTTAKKLWPDLDSAPGGDVARLRAVRVIDENGQEQEAVDVRKKIGVQMEFDVTASGYQMLPHFHLTNEEGVKLFVTVDVDPQWRRRDRPQGHYTSTVWVPGNLLAEGTVFISASLITLEPNIAQFHERDIISIQVIDSDEGDTARGDWVALNRCHETTFKLDYGLQQVTKRNVFAN